MIAKITLPSVDAARLDVCEKVIERGLASFVEVGEALLTIRENKLYRASHPTFEDYCRERWGFTDSRANQLIEAAGVTTIVVKHDLAAPATESQARELVPLKDDPEKMAEAWADVIEETDGHPTARAVRERVRPAIEEAGGRIVATAILALERIGACATLSPRELVISLDRGQRKRVLDQAREAEAWLGLLVAELERLQAHMEEI